MNKFRTLALAASIIVASTGFASAEAIVGNWKTQSGETAKISSCGSGFCIKLTTGEHAGKQIGRLSGSGGSYEGTITDPADNREYSGSAKVSGSNMDLRGCALRVFCRTQKWTKL